MIIIGITGTIGSGKGTCVDYLVKNRKFKHFSVRDYLSNKLREMNKPINRDNLAWLGNKLRKDQGASFIAEELYNQAAKAKRNCVIESLRNSEEVEALRKKGRFYLLAIDASPLTRYRRIKGRNSETDAVSLEEFLESEAREMYSNDPTKQMLSKCMSMADYYIRNDKSIKELHTQISQVLGDIRKRLIETRKRLSWDDYFMETVEAVSKRATCDRGRSGCVIVKDKQILATGYVGSPTGFPHCDDVGHLMKKVVNEDGTVSQHCVRTVHAEQNAICQAAKRGISIEGATVYCRMTPCRVCAMLLINSGIKRIYCERKYHAGAESEAMFKKARIKIEYKYKETQQYDNQKG